MGARDSARQYLQEALEQRVHALGEHVAATETPIASSAGDLVRRYPLPPPTASREEALAHFPVPDGDFVLTDHTLYYRDPRGMAYTLALGSITRWRQKRSPMYPHLAPHLQRRILEIEVRLKDGSSYLIEVGKEFARQVRKTGKIRRTW